MERREGTRGKNSRQKTKDRGDEDVVGDEWIIIMLMRKGVTNTVVMLEIVCGLFSEVSRVKHESVLSDD